MGSVVMMPLDDTPVSIGELYLNNKLDSGHQSHRDKSYYDIEIRWNDEGKIVVEHSGNGCLSDLTGYKIYSGGDAKLLESEEDSYDDPP
jgi:hypothetical protein